MQATLHSLQQLNNYKAKPSVPSILVVDDERIIRELCMEALREYKVFQATTCDEAMRLYECENFDLVLSDILMPGGTGIDLLIKIKALDPNAIVIIMTGFVDKEVVLSALKEGADDFINKPLNILQLKTAIQKALGRKALKEELAQMKRSDELKNKFLSLVSHKLRTPITGISLFLQNLQTGIFSPEDPIFQQSVKMAHDEVHHLGRLVADLLAFSQVMITDDGISRSSCDIRNVIADVLEACREDHAIYNVDLESADSLPLVLLDESKINFALYQLLDNAFKFSGKDGHITLKLESSAESLFIIVSDTGSGIPDSEIPKVFEKFYQIDPDCTGQVRGFGLGLFYAREFVRQHGGSINIASEPGLGTTATITLPLQ